jgi:hypothetical protein
MYLSARSTDSSPGSTAPRSCSGRHRGPPRAGCASIAYTYTEPTIFMELALETGRRAVEAGLRNVFVTTGT